MNRGEEINKWGSHRERQVRRGDANDSTAGALRMRRGDGFRGERLIHTPLQLTAATRLEREEDVQTRGENEKNKSGGNESRDAEKNDSD